MIYEAADVWNIIKTEEKWNGKKTEKARKRRSRREKETVSKLQPSEERKHKMKSRKEEKKAEGSREIHHGEACSCFLLSPSCTYTPSVCESQCECAASLFREVSRGLSTEVRRRTSFILPGRQISILLHRGERRERRNTTKTPHDKEKDRRASLIFGMDVHGWVGPYVSEADAFHACVFQMKTEFSLRCDSWKDKKDDLQWTTPRFFSLFTIRSAAPFKTPGMFVYPADSGFFATLVLFCRPEVIVCLLLVR